MHFFFNRIYLFMWINVFKSHIVLHNSIQLTIHEKKEEIWHNPMTKAPTPTEKSKQQRDNSKTSITTIETDVGRLVGVTTAIQLKPVYGIPTFPLTAAVV